MGAPSYFEIQVDNPERAIRFYRRVFGWTFERVEGLPVQYWRIDAEGTRGGLLERPAPAPPPSLGTNAFVCSMEVANFDTTATMILEHGGTVAVTKFAVPAVCWQGYFIDTEGNTFGVFEPNPSAK